MFEECLLPFNSVLYTADADAESKFKAAAFRGLEFLFAGTLSAVPSGGSEVHADDVPWPLMGRVELVVGGQARMSCEAVSLFHLASIFNGGYTHRSVPAPTATGDFASAFSIEFSRFVPGAGLDATGQDAYLRWKWRAGTYFGQGTTGAYTVGSARAKPYAITVPRKPAQGFREPSWTQVNHDLSTSSTKVSHTIDFKDAVDLPGILIEALDASAGAGTDAKKGVDGLIKNLTITVQRPGQAPKIVYDQVSWRALRVRTCRHSGLSADDETASVGVVYVPLFDRIGRDRDVLSLPANSSITIDYDTASTVEAGYTSVTPASGDIARVLMPAFGVLTDVSLAAATTEVADDRGRIRNAQRARRAGVGQARVRGFLR